MVGGSFAVRFLGERCRVSFVERCFGDLVFVSKREVLTRFFVVCFVSVRWGLRMCRFGWGLGYWRKGVGEGVEGLYFVLVVEEALFNSLFWFWCLV